MLLLPQGLFKPPSSAAITENDEKLEGQPVPTARTVSRIPVAPPGVAQVSTDRSPGKPTELTSIVARRSSPEKNIASLYDPSNEKDDPVVSVVTEPLATPTNCAAPPRISATVIRSLLTSNARRWRCGHHCRSTARAHRRAGSAARGRRRPPESRRSS